MELSFTKTIENVQKFGRDITIDETISPVLSSFSIKGSDITISFSVSLDQNQIDYVTDFVNNFVEVDITDNLKAYVETSVRPFIEQMLYRVQAENIEMGVTQSGKTYEVLGFFEKQYTLTGKNRAVSLKGSLDTNSLTVTLEVLGYLIATPGEYSDLSPFITATRLTDLYNEIAVFLGVATI